MPDTDLFAILNVLLVLVLLPLIVWATLLALRAALRGSKARSVFLIAPHDDFGARLERWCRAHGYAAARTADGIIHLQQEQDNELKAMPRLQICRLETHWQVEAWLDFYVPLARCEIAPDTANRLGHYLCRAFRTEVNLLLQLLEHPEMP